MATRPKYKVDSPAYAVENTRWLQERVLSGEPFPVPAGKLYVNGTATTKATVGCGRITTKGSGGYPIEDRQHELKGRTSQIVQLGEGPILRIAGAGFHCVDPLWLVNESGSTSNAIEFEGRTDVSSGRAELANLVLYNWDCGVKSLGGYYVGDKFIVDENHADNLAMTNCHGFNTRVYYGSDNEQAVNIEINRGGLWNHGPALDCIICDLLRGGLVEINGWKGSASRLTGFRVNWYSPNSCYLKMRGYKGDRMPVPDWRLTPIEYVETPNRPEKFGSDKIVTGPDWQTKACDYVFKWEGFVAKHLTEDEKKRGIKFEVDYKVPDDFPRNRWEVELN
jgi:hypothetical protein